MASRAKRRGRPAVSPEERENELINLAVDLAEEQLREGTASTAVITHYLKLATTREQLEKERLRYETMALEAKANAMNSMARSEELYNNALEAFTSYRSSADDHDDD